ncbi:MAG: DUF5615 family PIN-like protein, partial [Tunicatimonas sp.]|uniref:DUF5615 family PIN-like protein n=1 Tax=Tunicatimonas sp. TaxID=1940096 RepID=UPI003C777600
MFLLLDNHLSFRLIGILRTTYQELHHVKDYQLEKASDDEIWSFARQQKDAAIVTKDMDFYHLLNHYGPPPKVIWIRIGNSTTQHVAQLLIAQSVTIKKFLSSDTLS